MTEKRFTVDYDITTGNYCLHDECKTKGVDGYIAYLSDEERANNLCNKLNGQLELIKRLKTIREEQTETILKQKRKIKELEERNKRQYDSLKKISDLMYARDWKTLDGIVEDWEESDKLLKEIHWCFEKEIQSGDGE